MRLACLFTLVGLVGCYAPDIMEGGFACDPMTTPACPDGFTCGQCSSAVKVSPGFGCCVKLTTNTIKVPGGMCNDDLSAQQKLNDKKGASTPSAMSPTFMTTCVDVDLEGQGSNDGSGSACSTLITTSLDKPGGGVTAAICPVGPSKTGAHDVDYYQLDLSKGLPQTFNIVASLSYKVAQGDLDVGIFNAQGALIGWDVDTKDNACAAAVSQSPGTYYVVVVGAGALDSNNYTITVSENSSGKVCPK